jgi:RNA polymerase sigma-70 factor, ECF subfamily
VSSDREDVLDERALVESARADSQAFAELYRRYVARVYAFAYRRTDSTHVAEDITSATFERALRNLGSFTWRPTGFGPWLFRIAAHELVDHYRRTSRATSDRALRAAHAINPDEPADPVEAIVDRDAVVELLDAMDRLNPRYQRALSLRYLSGLTNDEAAAAMGTSKATMAVVVFRATRALRRAMRTDRQR